MNEPENIASPNKVDKSTRQLFVLIGSVLVLIAIMFGIVLLEKDDSTAISSELEQVVLENSKNPQDTSLTPEVVTNSVGSPAQIIPAQQELPMKVARVVPPSPYFNERNEDGISPNKISSAVGKRYLAQFSGQTPTAELTPLEVTVVRAAKYYAIKDNAHLDGLVYFPSCFETNCFDGKSFPIAVRPNNAVIALELEFRNDTKNLVYLTGSFARFMVDEEFIVPKGSKVTTNVSSGLLERFDYTPSTMVGASYSTKLTFWIEVPHDTREVTFMYGRDKEAKDFGFFDRTNLSLSIPLTFDNFASTPGSAGG